MLVCDICGEEALLEEDMKTHLLLSHLEREISCPLCSMAGLTYDEIQFHINTAHPEADTQAQARQDEVDKNKSRPGVFSSRCIAEGVRVPERGSPETMWLVPSLEESAKKLKASETRQNPQRPVLGGSRTQEAPDREVCTSLGKEQRYTCPVCALVCSDRFVLQEHVELHLQEQDMDRESSSSDLQLARELQEEEQLRLKVEESKREAEDFRKLQRQFGLDGSGGYLRQAEKSMEKAVSRGHMTPVEFHRKKSEMMESLASGIDDCKTRTTGVMSALYKHYVRQGHDIVHVWLSAETDHFSCSEGDRGWGCGYRNYQMLQSSLQNMELYAPCVTVGRVPNIPRVQALIEEAWQQGVDPQGASQFSNSLKGTRAWIGATEIFSLLTSLGIRAHIVDFPQPSGAKNTHPHLFEWVKKYFSCSASRGAKLPPRVVKTTQPPLYLQHQGHSRSIVGIEQRRNGSLCLLLFDPGCPLEDMRRLTCSNIAATALRSLRKVPSHLVHKQYQIVAVEGVLSPEEKRTQIINSRTLRAERIQ
ncbi:zinc finger-containing ubiquitin peptidase 1 [Brienomyrus brachyistius]|uniref:zinc finger-containing ubiquitin peptidase 1 n=1 Tax=Brienomyrus brachyistius TaxID=42636 RepID=UPI0020B191E4|nr:zinc finger-containing ubiquitin peptidase 1 [Brienomyrus brachyistius]